MFSWEFCLFVCFGFLFGLVAFFSPVLHFERESRKGHRRYLFFKEREMNARAIPSVNFSSRYFSIAHILFFIVVI